MTAAWLVLSLLAALGFYTASPHQRLWPRLGTRRRLLRVAAGLCLAVATAVAAIALGLWPGVFAALTAWMLALVLLPYLDAWRQARRSAAHVG